VIICPRNGAKREDQAKNHGELFQKDFAAEILAWERASFLGAARAALRAFRQIQRTK
jgi:hypothetical protein